ncbi:MAG: siroheme synthase [Flavobacteriales bacterium]|nr:MAG: siroheme synthase [Flavobacteriales bacterium]
MNFLYPVFLKMHRFETLIVGGGNVALEKLSFLLKSSPDAEVTLVSPGILSEIEELVEKYRNVKFIQREFQPVDLEGKQLVIVSTEKHNLNKRIQQLATNKGILTNVADTPALCDFYLGSIVTKGDLKIAISTNGKSPTFSKRFRQVLEEMLPEELPELLENLHLYRNKLNNDFRFKVKALNELTSSLLDKPKKETAT